MKNCTDAAKIGLVVLVEVVAVLVVIVVVVLLQVVMIVEVLIMVTKIDEGCCVDPAKLRQIQFAFLSLLN